MIAFDNGPAGGDYVRYIDALMARAAAAAAAGTLGGDGTPATTGARGEHVALSTAFPPTSPLSSLLASSSTSAPTPSIASMRAPAVGAASGATVGGRSPVVRRRDGSDAGSGFAAPTEAGRASVAAAAIASALMNGEVGRGALPAGADLLTLAMFLLGLAFVAGALLWPPLAGIGLVVGIALMFGGVRRLGPVIRRLTRGPNG